MAIIRPFQHFASTIGALHDSKASGWYCTFPKHIIIQGSVPNHEQPSEWVYNQAISNDIMIKSGHASMSSIPSELLSLVVALLLNRKDLKMLQLINTKLNSIASEHCHFGSVRGVFNGSIAAHCSSLISEQSSAKYWLAFARKLSSECGTWKQYRVLQLLTRLRCSKSWVPVAACTVHVTCNNNYYCEDFPMWKPWIFLNMFDLFRRT